eukprot:5170040-Amphidinium_carterae.1
MMPRSQQRDNRKAANKHRKKRKSYYEFLTSGSCGLVILGACLLYWRNEQEEFEDITVEGQMPSWEHIASGNPRLAEALSEVAEILTRHAFIRAPQLTLGSPRPARTPKTPKNINRVKNRFSQNFKL